MKEFQDIKVNILKIIPNFFKLEDLKAKNKFVPVRT